MDVILAVLFTILLLTGPLGWRLWVDHTRAEADAIAADIRAAVNHRLRGESFLAVQVVPRGLMRVGRIVLSTPSGYTWLVEQVAGDVAQRIPAGYELVVPAPTRALSRSQPAPPLARAA